MGRMGIGLRPLIALHLLMVLATLAILLGYAAFRLSRHTQALEQVRWARLFLAEAARQIERECPGLRPGGDGPERPCGALSRIVGEWPSVHVLSLVDAGGKLLQTTDPSLEASRLWDAFGSRTPLPVSEDAWMVSDGRERRLLLAATVTGSGLRLQGAFAQQQPDELATRLLRSLLLYAGLLVGVTGLAGFWLLNRLVVRPMERLLLASDRISVGDLGFLLATDRGSEFGRLGFSLSQMARRIEEDRKRLQDQLREQTRLNRELCQAQQGLIRSEKLASVGRLSAGLAHELGNPMSAILGYVGMLRRETLPESDQKDILARVEKEVERIDRVIRDLLAYSRPGRGKMAALPPGELLENAMLLIRPQKKFKQVSVQVEVPPDLPQVLADPDLTRQVLVNLLLNALDAVPEKGHVWARATLLGMEPDGSLAWPPHSGEPPFFALGPLHRILPPQGGKGLRPAERVVVFSVSDDGCGIAAADLGRIFDPFFTTKEPGKGTGLGLAICHSAVASMQGEIWAFSEQGTGSQLAFYLPVAPARPALLTSDTARVE